MQPDLELLRRAFELACSYLETLDTRPVGARATRAQLLQALGGPLPQRGEDPTRALEGFVSAVEPGLSASAGPRYFGFVVGGSLPAAVAADWLTAAWDQNAAFHVHSPAAATVEEVTAGWVLGLLGLPPSASVGFVTGGQMANFTCLAAARNEVLRRVGWDVERDGLIGAPPLRVLVGGDVHVTIPSALRMLGLGEGRMERVRADGQGRMIASELARALEGKGGPTIVCAQAGNVNSGAFDPVGELADLTRGHGAWLHVDGAFGLWAAASPSHRQRVPGLEKADSWATDGHKWLNVPYDSGLAITAHPDAHRAAVAARAPYLVLAQEARNPFEWVPEMSRRARAFPLYLVLRTLGREGVAALVDRCCALARRMAEGLEREKGVRVLNDVVLNQALIRFEPPGGGDADALTRAVIARVQHDGVCWLGGTTWDGMSAMRISVSNWATTEADADRSVRAILDAFQAEARG
ncbi:MAG TPA: pyridoxal-dependent decarboxylase [Myxococcaceae bacterium]|nr:pyridoxal-dependent decarboxylase [Myxococcaceae bacterium]